MRSHRNSCRRLCTILFSGACLAAVAAAAETEDPQSIVMAARREAATAAQVEVAAVQLAAGFAPDQLRLPRCSSALSARARQIPRPGTRQSLEVVCPAPSWRVFVPVAIEGSRRVIVLARALPAGSILGRDDLMSVEQPGATVPDSAAQAAEDLVGTRLLRSLAAGQVLVPGFVRRPPAVRRGQAVDVFARTETLTVRTRGIAVADASIAERVKVRNPSSGREFEGIVNGIDSVEIRLD